VGQDSDPASSSGRIGILPHEEALMKGAIFTYLLTAAGATAGLFDPYYGLLVYVCFAIIRPEWMWRWSLDPGNYSRIVAIGLLVGWALAGFGRWKLGRAWGVIAPLLAYWAWSALCVTQAPDQDRAVDFVVYLAKVVLPVLVGITTVDSVLKLKLLGWVIVASQGFVALQLNLYYFGGYNMAWEEGFGGMDNNCIAIAMVTGVGLAFFLGMGAPKWWSKLLAFAAAALMGHVIMFSFSRGGLLALLITGVFSFFLVPKKPVHYAVFALAVLLAIRMAGPSVRERFMTSFGQPNSELEASAESRLQLWSGCLDATAQRPVLGIGPDNWGEIAPEYGWKRGKEAHSLWLQTMAETGIPGVLFLAAFYLVGIVRLWPLTREQTPVPDPWMRDAARMVIASLIGFVIAAQFVTIKYLEVPLYVALLGAGVLRLVSEAQTRAAAGQVWAPVWSGTVPGQQGMAPGV
jgi:O-antigen ligase